MGEMIQSPMVAVSREDLTKVCEGLRSCVEFFIRRDEMNSVVHLAEPRYSPITELASGEWNRVQRMLIDVRP